MNVFSLWSYTHQEGDLITLNDGSPIFLNSLSSIANDISTESWTVLLGCSWTAGSNSMEVIITSYRSQPILPLLSTSRDAIGNVVKQIGRSTSALCLLSIRTNLFHPLPNSPMKFSLLPNKPSSCWYVWWVFLLPRVRIPTNYLHTWPNYQRLPYFSNPPIPTYWISSSHQVSYHALSKRKDQFSRIAKDHHQAI